MSYLSNFNYQITESLQEPNSDRKLVFLHGVMGFGVNWRRIVKAFEKKYQVLTYDQRGHGRSFHPAVGYGVEDYSDDLRKILDELGWERIHLVGHSMGGRVAFHFASEFPERVTRLVIEDMGPSMLHDGAEFITQLLDSIPVPFSSKREAKKWFDTEFVRLFATVRNVDGLAAFLYANLIEDESRKAVWRFYESGIRESIAQGRAVERWDEIAELKMPTLVVRGEHSNDLPRETYLRVLEANPLIQGVEVSGVGHWIHSEKPEVFISILAEFFGQSLTTKSSVR